MKIKELRINSRFRNLDKIALKFNPDGTTVIIGNNGSGKSNIIEAISSIFSSLYNRATSFEFDFVLQYSIDGRNVKIINSKSRIEYSVDKKKVELLTSELLPSRIICNYSGEDDRLWNRYYKSHYDNFINAVKGDSIPLMRMVYVDKKFWNVALLTLLCCEDEIWSFRSFKKTILGINTIDEILIKIDNEQLKKWNTNPVSLFIRVLLSRILPDNTILLENINPDSISAREFYNYIVAAYELFKDIDIKYNGGISSKMMSEGEKKLLIIEFILEVIADEKSLVIMDEPDSHIHVSRKAELKK